MKFNEYEAFGSTRWVCAGCAANVAPPFTTLTDDGALVGLLCAPCDQRHDVDAVFARIVDACARDGKTIPEVTAAFAHYGVDIPTTEATMRSAAARTGWVPR